jgi:hypothetical protein
MKLEDLTPNASVRGILPDAYVTVETVQWHGSDVLTLIYRGPSGRVAEEILYRSDEPRLEIVEQGRPWSFDGDGALFRLVSEAHRIRLAHLFDPVLAVHTSLVEPLPTWGRFSIFGRGNPERSAAHYHSQLQRPGRIRELVSK